MLTRRELLLSTLAAGGGTLFLTNSQAASVHSHHQAGHTFESSSRRPLGFTPVVTPNGKPLAYRMKNGVKEFHLVAEPVMREFAPGMTVKCWGYNGLTPGPTI